MQWCCCSDDGDSCVSHCAKKLEGILQFCIEPNSFNGKYPFYFVRNMGLRACIERKIQRIASGYSIKNWKQRVKRGHSQFGRMHTKL